MAEQQAVPGTQAGLALGETLVIPGPKGEEHVDHGRLAGPKRPFSFGRWFKATGWRHLVGLVVLVFALFPIVFVISSSLNPNGTLTGSNALFSKIGFDAYARILTNPQVPFTTWFANTLIIAGITAVLTVFLGALAAYAFSRMRFTGRRFGLISIVVIQMFPQFLAAVALYLMFTDLGAVIPAIGLDTLAGYILMMCGGSLGQVWLIKGFFDSIPMSLDEAAMIDGASHVQVFFRIILPLVRPILAVCGLLVFVGVIGEFLMASIFLRDSGNKTLATGLYGLIDADRSNNLGVFAAGSIMTAIPVVLLFLYLQRFIVGGITAGGVKG